MNKKSIMNVHSPHAIIRILKILPLLPFVDPCFTPSFIPSVLSGLSMFFVMLPKRQHPSSGTWIAGNVGYKDESAEEKNDNIIRGYLVCFKIKRKFTSGQCKTSLKRFQRSSGIWPVPITRKKKSRPKLFYLDVFGPLACSHQNQSGSMML
jgi:hypothetical protein